MSCVSGCYLLFCVASLSYFLYLLLYHICVCVFVCPCSDNVTLTFDDAAIREIARISTMLNRSIENIGARRLNTVIQKILDDISFEASDLPAGSTVHVDVKYVKQKVNELLKNDIDLAKHIL